MIRHRDGGFSSLIGFVVGMVMLVAATASVAYYIGNTPDPEPERSSGALRQTAVQALDTLVASPGVPADWDDDPAQLERIGFLLDGQKDKASWDKVQVVNNGQLSHVAFLEALGLREKGLSVYVKGELRPSEVVVPPKRTTYGIYQNTSISGGSATPDPGSLASLAAICITNEDCNREDHLYEFAWDADPSDEADDRLHPDHPWFIETDLLPQMAGLIGTDASVGALNATLDEDTSRQAAIDAYLDDGRVTRWRTMEDNGPFKLPSSQTVDYALGMAWKKEDVRGEGVGLWRVHHGERAWAFLGPVSIGSADSVELSLRHLLELGDGSVTYDELGWATYNATILYWNAFADRWAPIQPNPNEDACNGGSTGWDSTTEQSSWGWAQVDLCQAVQNSGGTLYLAFYWESHCVSGIDEGDEVEIPCDDIPESDDVDEGESAEEAGYNAYWFLDQVHVNKTRGGETTTVFTSDFAPDGSEKLLLMGEGMNHGLHGAAPTDHTKKSLVQPFTAFVETNGTVIALRPGAAGNWLGELGLEAVVDANTVGSYAAALQEDHLFQRIPYEISSEGDPHYATTAYAWSTGTVSSPISSGGSDPVSTLTPVHQASDSNSATVLEGRPRGIGGKVAAISYDLSDEADNNEDLQKKLVRNLYATSLFRDPSFTLTTSKDAFDHTIKAGGQELATAKRQMPVAVTTDDAFSIPVDVTLYLWGECVGDGGPSDPCGP